jgi:hypothetical protein
MKKEFTEQSAKDFAFNGGIPPAYRTLPTWEVAPINQDKTYADMFKPSVTAPSISPQARSASNPQIPHQHQLPYQVQQNNQTLPQTTNPAHAHHHLHSQQHHQPGPPHFDDHHRMQVSASSSQMYPSPRLQPSHLAYQSPIGPHAQLAFGQPVPFYVGQGPQPSHIRHYPGGPQFISPQNGMGAPMMVQQPSGGPYIGIPQGMAAPYNPQMQMYSPGPGHAYPQHVQPQPQPHSGYPSPSQRAPIMMHQGSQQGQPPQSVMFMNPGQHGQPVYAAQQPGHSESYEFDFFNDVLANVAKVPQGRPGYPQQQQQQQQPHFSSSPHQPHHYPHHQHRGQNNNYSQIPHIHPPHMQPQGAAQVASVPHAPETADDVK